MRKRSLKICAFLLAIVMFCTNMSPAPAFVEAAVNTTADNYVTSDDFEDFNTSKSYWTGSGISQGTDGKNHFLVSTQKGLATSSYYKYTRPVKIQFSVNGGGESGIFLYADGADADGNPAIQYKGLWFYNFYEASGNQTLGLWGYDAYKNTNRILNNNTNRCATTDSRYIRFKQGEWIDIAMEMDYSKWADSRTVSITYVVTGKIHGIMIDNVNRFDNGTDVFYEKNGTTYRIGDTFTFDAVTYDYVFTGAAYDAPLRFGIGNPGNGTMATIKIDDYTAEYDLAHGQVCRYIDTHRDVLTGADSTKKALDQAVEGYFALDASQKRIVEQCYPDGVAALGTYLEENNTDAEITAFRNEHAAILAMTAETMTPSEESALAAAEYAFTLLSDKGKLTLFKEGQRLQELRTALNNYVESRQDGDYRDWCDDFESGTTKLWDLEDWSVTDPSTKYNYYVDVSVIDEPGNEENKVLSFSQCGGFRLIPKRSTWPKKGAMTSLSYSFKGMPGLNNSYRHKFYVYYIDEENYAYVCVSAAGATYLVTISEGQSKEEARQLSGYTMDVENWMDITVTYDQTKLEYLFQITERASEGDSIVWAGKLPNGSGYFVIGQERNAMMGSGAYIDNVKVEFLQTEGDWDVDETITEFEPYYDSNVWMNPEDIVTITGENLGALTGKVQLVRLEDTVNFKGAGTTVRYPGQQTYKYDPDADTNTRRMDMDSILAAYGSLFTEESTVPIEQKTIDSIKFRIPKNQEPGIYAVKLTNNAEGKDAILFINRPHMGFAYGEDGGSTKAGGDLRVIGRRLVLDRDGNYEASDYANTHIALVNSSGRVAGVFAAERSEDIYSVHITVPEELPVGKYEAYVHNGFGDDHMWSEAGTIEITAKDVRSTWPQKVFDVTDYGAVGDQETNCTPAFIAAMEAADANGGGIVYVPKGAYTLIHTIVIPEHVSLKGAGEELTQLIWDVSTWDIGDVRTLMSVNGNVEICDLSIYGSRHREILFANGSEEKPRENIYVHDIRVKFYNLTETMTEGAGDVGWDGKYSVAELYQLLYTECVNMKTYKGVFDFGENTNTVYKDTYNIRLEDIELYGNDVKNTLSIKMGGYYNYLRNVKVKQGSGGWWSGLTYDYGIMEECDAGENGTVGFQGNNWYVAHNRFHDNAQNNREAYTTDGSCIFKDIILSRDTSDATGKTYKVVGTVIGSDLSGRMIMIAKGQGYSQIRRIVSNTQDTIVVESPFAVEPNRNSRAFIHNMRTDNIFVGNEISNCGAFGSYGTMIDYVFDDNSFSEAYGYVMNIWTQFIWGVSMINSTIKDAYTIHGTGSIGTSSSNSGIQGIKLKVQGALYAGAMHSVLVRDIDFRDGANLEATFATVGDCAKDVVLQRNSFDKETKNALIFVTAIADCSNLLDGYLLADNTYAEDISRYNSTFRTTYERKKENKTGDLKIKIIGESYEVIVNGVEGDADLDGKFGLKDIIYVRYYLAEKISVPEKDRTRFIAQADVTKDGVVDLRDVQLMRKALLAGGWEYVDRPSTGDTPPATYTVTLMNDGQIYNTISITENGRYTGLSAITPPTKEGYTFEGWFTAENGGTKVTDSVTVTVNSNHTLYAHWTKKEEQGGETGGDGDLTGEIVPDKDVFH